MLLGETDKTIGTLFHSIDLDISLYELQLFMRSKWYPFKTFYEVQCETGIDLERYNELLHIENIETRRILLSAECLRRSKIIIVTKDIDLLPDSILRTSGKLPDGTSRGAFLRSVNQMLASKNLEIKTCKWLFGTDVKSLGREISKLDTFWMLYHPACYLRELPTDYRVENPSLMDSQRLQTSGYLLERYKFVDGVSNLPQFFRWICQVAMVGIQLKRSFPDQRMALNDVEVTMGQLKDEIDGNPVVGLLYGFEKDYLVHVRRLLRDVLQAIRVAPKAHEPKQAIKPSFNSLLGLILGALNESEAGAIAMLNHWKLQLCLIFIEVYKGHTCPEVQRVLWELRGTPSVFLWTLDLIQLTEYVLDYHIGGQEALLYDLVLQHAESHADLQRYIVTVLHKRHASSFPPCSLPGRLSFLFRAVPIHIRLSFVRELAFTYYQGHFVDQIRAKHQKFYGTNPSQTIAEMMAQFFSLETPLADEMGRIRISDPFWNKATLKSFGHMCALSVLYGIRLPIYFDEGQLKLLLGFDQFEIHRLSSAGDGSDLFPDAPMLLASDRKQIRKMCSEMAAIVMTAFRSSVRFAGALSWHEIAHLLIPTD